MAWYGPSAGGRNLDSNEQEFDQYNARSAQGLITPVTSPEQEGMAPLVRVGGRIDSATTKELVLSCYDQAEEESQEIRETWEELYAHYRMNVKNDQKEDWQSQVYLPELNPAVKKSASMFQSILLQSDSYFELNSDDPNDKPWLAGQEAAIRYHHDQPWRPDEGGKIIHSRGGIMDLFYDNFESIAIFGISASKLSWKPKQRKTFEYAQGGWEGSDRSQGSAYQDSGFDMVRMASSSLYYCSVDPRRLWFDDERSFTIEERLIYTPNLWPMVDGGLLDEREVGKVINTDYGTDSKTKEWLESRGIKATSNAFRKRVHLFEYWGDILDRNGKIVQSNARVILANKNVILNPNNMSNPFWHGQSPYVISSPLKVLFRSIGQSIIEGGLTAQLAINDIARMVMDGMLIRLLKPLWLIWDRLQNKNEIKDLKPLQLLHFFEGEKGGPPIGEVPLGDIPNGALAETEVLRRSLQNATFLGDINMALSPSKDTTATEVAIKSKESHGIYQTMARSIEQQVIEPTVEMTRWLMLQFWDDFNDPALMEMGQKYGLPFMAPDRASRLQFLAGSVQIRSKGISGFFQRVNERNDLVEFLKVVGATPEFLIRVNKRDLIDRVTATFHFQDAEKLLIPEELDAQITQLEMQRFMMSLAGPMMGGAPGGPGAPGGGGMPSSQEMDQAVQMMMQAGIDPESPQGQQILAEVQSRMGQGGGGGNAPVGQ